MRTRGTPFIDEDDKGLAGAIAAERSREGYQDARVIVLAGIDAIEHELAAMQQDEKALLIGTDNTNPTSQSYIPIVEMLRAAPILAADPAA